MRSDEPQSPYLAFRIIYKDLPDLIEVEARVVNGDWSGTVCAYASPDTLREEARRIGDWARHPETDCILEAGDDGWPGWFRLQFYTIHRAGHARCYIQMATPSYPSPPMEKSWRLAVEMRTEPGLVERFANEICSIIPTVGAEALLVGVHKFS